MLNIFRKRINGQSIIEYVSLILIVSAAVSGMSIYVSRILEIRQRHLNQELNESTRGAGQI
ncbi:MAG: hypothetical protein WC330_02105 [Candidatus Omnitrophota bacterium]|jgi:hypothetical protein